MNNYNNIPNSGTFGNVVNVVNQNFSLTKQAIEQVFAENIALSERVDKLGLERISCVGFYKTNTDLANANPNPTDNNWAVVGTEDPYTIYVAENGEWVSSGGNISIGVDFSNYVSLSTFNESQETQDTRLANLEGFRMAQEDENANLSGSIQGVANDLTGTKDRVAAVEKKVDDLDIGTEDGLFYTDSAGNIALKYTPTSGFDVAKLSSHFKSLLPTGDIYSDLTSINYNI